MAKELPILVLPGTASGDLTGKQYRFVKMDSNGEIAIAGAGEAAVGVLLDEPAAQGRGCTYMALGMAKVVYGADVAVGANLASDANGKAVTAADDAAVLAVALEGGALNEIRSVLLATRATAGVTAATEILIPGVASGDLTGKANKFVVFDAEGKIAVATAGSKGIGVLQNAPDAEDEACIIKTAGIVNVVLGETVTIGAKLAIGADGVAVAATGKVPVVAIAAEGGTVGQTKKAVLTNDISDDAYKAYSVVSIPIDLAKITQAGDVVTEWVPGFAGVIEKVAFVVTTPTTTADKTAKLNLEIGSTNVTGGIITLSSAAASDNTGTLGEVTAGTAITADNAFDADDKISVEAAEVTAFAEGAGVLLITIRS